MKTQNEINYLPFVYCMVGKGEITTIIISYYLPFSMDYLYGV